MSLSACSQSADVETYSPEMLLSSLGEMTIESLRSRTFRSSIKVETLNTNSCVDDNPVTSLPGVDGDYKSYMASYSSDGLRQYARLTVPSAQPPKSGYPFILFLHGYIGKDKAPSYSIGCRPENMYYSELTDAFARAGYAILSPGYRGHATVNGIPAEGIEYLEAFDQGAGLSTQFYAVDALNFAAGIGEIDGSGFSDQSFDFDMSRFFLLGHSQGGDAGLTYLAVIGEGHQDDLRPVHSALWSGTFLDRLTALEKMMPVAMTAEAFLSGDRTWTGTAVGENGEINSNFVFGFPPDWIETPNPSEWTWQNDSWNEPDVRSAISKSVDKMYADLSENVSGLQGLEYSISASDDGPISVNHDPRISKVFPDIGAFHILVKTSPFMCRKKTIIRKLPGMKTYVLACVNGAGIVT